MAGQKVYEIVTEQILNQLDAGVVPWRKPWGAGGMPANYVSRHEYHGVNALLLSTAPYACPWWLTFHQVGKLGGRVRKGEHGRIVIFWTLIRKEEDGEGSKGSTGAKGSNGKASKAKGFPLLRYYRVWNWEQTEGVPARKGEPATLTVPAEGLAGEYLAREGVRLIKGTACAYSPSADHILMVPVERFEKPDGYWHTLFHEITHSTGNKRRLDRDLSGNFGSGSYSREELIAELGASFLSARTGVTPPIEQAAAYIASWRGKLKDDPRLIVQAAAAAQKAADFVAGKAETGEQEQEEAAKVA